VYNKCAWDLVGDDYHYVGIAVQAELTAELLEREVDRRRTFAIISHPDAGKVSIRMMSYFCSANDCEIRVTAVCNVHCQDRLTPVTETKP
jgi:hypothetical protein